MLARKLEEADRLLRRGELVAARSAYVALLAYASGPEAGVLRGRISSVDDLLGPSDVGPAALPAPADGPTPQQLAETAINEGRVDDAIGLYAAIMARHPDDMLARERMTELLTAKTRVVRSKMASSTTLRTLTTQDSLNASIAGEHESGPLGRALEGAKSKPLPAAPAPRPAPVSDSEFDVEMEMDVELANGGVTALGGLLPGEAPRTPVPVSDAVVALPSASSPVAVPVAAVTSPAASAKAPGAPLPADPPALLRELLARVHTHRRAPSRLLPFPSL